MNQDRNNPEILCRTANEFEAGVIIAALAETGIRARADGGFTAGFIAEAPGDVSVVVAQSDLKAAQKVLEKIQQAESQTDWSTIDVGEPEDA